MSAPDDRLDLDVDDTRFEVRTGWCTVRGERDKHRVELASPDSDVWLNLSLIASAHRAGVKDETFNLEPLDVAHYGGHVRVRAIAASSAWDAHVVELDCLPTGLLLRLQVEGAGLLGAVTLAGGDAVQCSGAAGTFRSGGTHDTVFSPAPSEPVAPLRPAAAAVQLGVVGDAEPGRLHGLFSPPPLVVGLGRRDRTPGMPWLGLGLVAAVEHCTFTTMRYEPLDGGFLIRLEYEEHTAVAGTWTSPDLAIRPADGPYDVIDGLREALDERRLIPVPRQAPRWALEPIFCGWGAQCAAAVRACNGGDNDLVPSGTRASDLARADVYDGWLAYLDEHGVRPGTIVLDDRWQQEYGTNRPDEAKWPDLRGWIADRHAAGQRVLLWFKAWDPEGLPAELCVRTPDGTPVAVDPGNPDYLAELDRQVHTMLAPDGLDADGFKVDFTQRAPSGTALTSAAGPADAVWGVAALHTLLATIEQAAHRSKPDALVITHAVDPRFGDVADLIRLNDVLERDAAGKPVPVVDQMRHRAEVANRALPGHPLDTDQWPMPNREQWVAYAAEQPSLGVPALYYVTSIDNSDEDLTACDLRHIAGLWAAYRAELGTRLEGGVMDDRRQLLPPHFEWGVATSAYQIEGATTADGRGESIWDRFSATPGRTANGDTGEIACDHYHRFESDLDLMAELGVDNYRFSIAWPRIHPDGGSVSNPAGIAFYDRLVDGLLARGIRPTPTLYHWDLPQALQDDGGWTARATAERFTEYATTMFDALGDRVGRWITHNEPWMAGFIAHLRGVHAPGMTDLRSALLAAHHILLSHGLAVRAYRDSGGPGEIGITLNLMPTYPASDCEADREAARGSDGFTNRWFLDPLYRASYPADMIERFERAGALFDFVAAEDLDVIASPTDFLGVNYYAPRRISASGEEFGWRVEEPPPPGVPRTGMGGEIFPEGLTDLLRRLRDDYAGPPIYVTENGYPSYDDHVDADGRVHDPDRVDFLREHLAAASDAIEAGVDLRGYYAWSLMDNFEWAEGYGPRFGIVFVDYADLARIPKDSFAFYARTIAAHKARRVGR